MYEHDYNEVTFGYALPTLDTDIEYLAESDIETLNNLLSYCDTRIPEEDEYAS